LLPVIVIETGKTRKTCLKDPIVNCRKVTCQLPSWEGATQTLAVEVSAPQSHPVSAQGPLGLPPFGGPVQI